MIVSVCNLVRSDFLKHIPEKTFNPVYDLFQLPDKTRGLRFASRFSGKLSGIMIYLTEVSQVRKS
jgi:hypothetical protein